MGGGKCTVWRKRKKGCVMIRCCASENFIAMEQSGESCWYSLVAGSLFIEARIGFEDDFVCKQKWATRADEREKRFHVALATV